MRDQGTLLFPTVNITEVVVETTDIFITSTGKKGINTAGNTGDVDASGKVENIGHFENEIEMAGINRLSDVQHRNIKP